MTQILAYIILTMLVLVLIYISVSIYNKLVMLRNNIDKAYANIDVLLKQRVDEVPNLINTLKEFMKYEENALVRLTEMRTKFLSSNSTEEKINLYNKMQSQMKTIYAVAENYPLLNASQNFQLLQKRLSEIENSISDRREYYNESVNMYNIGIEQFPNNVFSKILLYRKKEPLKITDQEKKYDGVAF